MRKRSWGLILALLGAIAAPAAEPVKRFSKYKIVSALGSDWPAMKARIEAAGLLELWNAANELATDDPALAGFLAALSDEEKTLLEGCEI